MASPDEDKKTPRKKVETMRERAERAILEASKPSKRESPVETESNEINRSKILRRGKKQKKEKKPRRFHILPKFIRNAFAEIKLVTWPDRITTLKLTTAVIIFATVFALFVSIVDFGFGRLFKRIFLHG